MKTLFISVPRSSTALEISILLNNARARVLTGTSAEGEVKAFSKGAVGGVTGNWGSAAEEKDF